MLRNLLIPGIISGIIAGALLTLVQQFNVIPLILEAETYEVKSEQHSHTTDTHEHGATDTNVAQVEWSPHDGNERTLFTLMTNIILGIGFSLLLVSLMTASKFSGWRSGMFWGLAGFCVFFLAPSLGQPPELPGAVQATLEHRQLWWAATVASTAIGLGLLFLNPATTFRIFGVVFIIAPHFFTNSVSITEISSVPEELIRSFIITTSFANILFWLVIGTVNGFLKSHYFESLPIQEINS
ncbi:Predicted cobalt transporter CbtA [hydrothermal vent metagenome]|uniref:Predicted cobalt transporter CbtA n=1 Tax=hydrothermal vent metagenome TaxID=652676 RepID=A0A3B0ZLK3_9ZZZZ